MKECPIKHSDYANPGKCTKDRCGLWDDFAEACSILAISRRLGDITKYSTEKW